MHLPPLPPPPAAKGGAADREAVAESWGFHPGGVLALGIEFVMAHGCLPSASSQLCRCQSRCERRQPGFLGTRWRPGLSRPLRLIANSVERLIASWAQSCSVVSRGLERDMAAGAAGWGQRGRLPRVEGAFTHVIEGGLPGVPSPADDL